MADRTAAASSGISGRFIARALDLIERAGNRLPHPITIFCLFAAAVPVISAVAAAFDVSVINPRTGQPCAAVNLLTRPWIQRAFTDCVANFVAFAPLGTVLTAMLGIGIAERCGLIDVLLRLLVQAVPAWALTAMIVFAGLLSHTAADAGFLIVPPLAMAMFAALGRSPLAGLALAFASVAGGLSANVLPGSLDVLLAMLTQEAARLIEPKYEVQVICNYYFLAASVPLLVGVAVSVNRFIVEPRLGPALPEQRGELQPLTGVERRGLRVAALAAVVTLIGLLLLVAPEWGPLRTEGATTLQRIQPFLRSVVALVLIVFLIPGVAYGAATGRIRNDHDVARMSGETMAAMGLYIALAFPAAQFVKYFEWSNLGTILAVSGAGFLRSIHVNGVPLFIGLLLISTMINLLIASASAKWTILAPIFVPMFMLLGHSPESTQAVYRVGDSITNPITPLNNYFPIMLAFAHRYDPKFGIGSLVSVMLPYTIAFALFWTGLLIVWIVMGWPLGPGSPLTYGAG